MAKSKFLQEFQARGFLHQCTDEEALDNLLCEAEQSGKGISAYIGFDCTATSLHVGNLIQIMILRLLKKHGHNPIILLGGGTTKVGDPSGKDESRPVITDEIIAQNMAGIKSSLEQFGLGECTFVNNDEWLSGLGYINFLRDIGPHFTINRMLSYESVKLRIDREQPMTFIEFNYMILQAYDFVELNKRYGCRLQLGGSDQWGNIINGVELQRRLNPGNKTEDVIFGLTTPLITTASGAKMGKTAAGAVWLNPDRVSPYDYWQFWRNTEDADIWRFMRFFTDIDLDQIATLENKINSGANINDAKKVLANSATALCHGEAESTKAEETARKVFEQGGIGDDLPVIDISKSELDAGIPAFKILNMAGLAESGGAARRLIKGGGAKINDEKIVDDSQIITTFDINTDGVIKLSAGKKKHALVKIS